MKKILFVLLLLSAVSFAQSPEEKAVQVVQAQLEAYNQQDIKAFMKVFSEDISIYNFGDSNPIASGKEKVTEVYKNLFESSPNLHSQVVNRSVIGNTVLDYEIISGRQGGNEISKIIAIYEIENGLIKKATFIRE
ncbi:MAG: nuclear transport factor 2 family protein [Flavobacteriaceae bacterium]|nr:nuclear transport factor 2 family protein [Flavobacteriaceae bacterium]